MPWSHCFNCWVIFVQSVSRLQIQLQLFADTFDVNSVFTKMPQDRKLMRIVFINEQKIV